MRISNTTFPADGLIDTLVRDGPCSRRTMSPARLALCCASVAATTGPASASPAPLQFRIGPRPRAGLRQATDLPNIVWRHWRRRMPPLAADVGQHRRNLLVGERAAERRHQPDCAFLAGEQDAGGGAGIEPVDVTRLDQARS